MKRVITILLVLCMMLSFASCGSKNEPAPQNPDNGSQNEPAKPDESKLKGETTDSAYTNEYLGLRIVLPAGWSFYTEEQMAMVNNMTADAYKDTDVSQAVSSAGQYMTMMMANITGSSYNLIVQPKNPLIDNYTDEQIFQNVESEMKRQFESTNIKVNKFETVKLQVAGEERDVLHMVLDFGNIMDEYQVWYRPEGGNYMGVLTLAIPEGSDPKPFLDCITKLK